MAKREARLHGAAARLSKATVAHYQASLGHRTYAVLSFYPTACHAPKRCPPLLLIRGAPAKKRMWGGPATCGLSLNLRIAGGWDTKQ